LTRSRLKAPTAQSVPTERQRSTKSSVTCLPTGGMAGTIIGLGSLSCGGPHLGSPLRRDQQCCRVSDSSLGDKLSSVRGLLKESYHAQVASYRRSRCGASIVRVQWSLCVGMRVRIRTSLRLRLHRTALLRLQLRPPLSLLWSASVRLARMGPPPVGLGAPLVVSGSRCDPKCKPTVKAATMRSALRLVRPTMAYSSMVAMRI
jgi:hypothetical protein